MWSRSTSTRRPVDRVLPRGGRVAEETSGVARCFSGVRLRRFVGLIVWVSACSAPGQGRPTLQEELAGAAPLAVSGPEQEPNGDGADEGSAGLPGAERATGFSLGCEETHPDFVRAQAAVSVFEGAVDGASSVEEILSAYEGVFAVPCMGQASNTKVDLATAVHPAQVKGWWRNGGDVWLRSLLGASRTLVFPPGLPPVWVAKKGEPEIPESMRCGLEDGACSPDTDTWRSRAAQHMTGWYARRKYGKGPDPDLEQSCLRHALLAESPFETFSHCMGNDPRARTDILPLNGVDIPRTGWVVLQGRRGHYSFCDEIRAYDLATGAAHVASSCTGLALGNNGSVDHRTADGGRAQTVTRGHVQVDALREFVWVLLMAQQARINTRASAQSVAIPPGLAPPTQDRGGVVVGPYLSAWSSGHTQIRWRYHTGTVAFEGRVNWPSDLNVAIADHAVKLLQAVESGFQEGCPSVRLPKRVIPKSVGGGVSGIDAEPASPRTTHDRLVEALRRTRTKSCSARTRRGGAGHQPGGT